MKVFKLLIEAFRIDVLNVNVVCSDEAFSRGYLGSLETAGMLRSGSALGYAIDSFRFIGAGVKGALSIARLSKKIQGGQVCFVAMTSNHRASMCPVFDETSADKHFIDPKVLRSQIQLASLVSLPFLPVMLYRCWKASAYVRENFASSFTTYWRTYGLYLVSHWWIGRNRPACLVLSNDHVGSHRIWNTVAIEQGIPTVYIQHACVADHFPSLDFSYALLDGMDAAKKYLNKPTDCTVFLIGITKYESRDSAIVSKPGSRLRLGISFNMLDSFEQIDSVLSTIKGSLPEASVSVRLHPRSPKNVILEVQRICSELSVNLSDAPSESSFDFLGRVDVHVSGASGIVLDAAMLGVPSVVLFSELNHDVYGFVKGGLCLEAFAIDDLPGQIEHAITHRDSLSERVAEYCEGFGMPGFPQSKSLAARLIDEITTSEIDEQAWEIQSVGSGAVRRLGRAGVLALGQQSAAGLMPRDNVHHELGRG